MGEADAKMSARDKHLAMFNKLKYPVSAFGVLYGVHSGLLPTGSWIWFSYHPLLMLVACTTLAANAALIKKVGGLQNTLLHGNLMSAAAALMLAGLYVIYSNKDMHDKPHFVTWHAWIGLACTAAFALLGLAGAATLHPEWGRLKTNTTVRKLHKYSGRLAIFLSWVACATGFETLQSDPMQQAFFAVPLMVAAYLVLLR